MLAAASSLESIHPDYARLRQTKVSPEPYPHFCVPGFLPPHSVSAVLRDFPALGAAGLFVPHNASGALAELIKVLEGAEFRAILGEKLDLDLSAAPTLVTIRDRCQPKDGRIHADASFKLATALVYLNETWTSADGRLRILRSPTDINDHALEIPPEGGLLACFRVQPNSWHGHTRFSGPRRYIMLNYCNGKQAQQRERARHRMSAKLKRARLFLRNCLP